MDIDSMQAYIAQLEAESREMDAEYFALKANLRRLMAECGHDEWE